jgi:hypothetical protein
MATPLVFAIRQRTNEAMIASVILPWRVDQWPLPAGSSLRCDVRATPGDVDRVLTFSTSSRTIALAWDEANTQLIVTLRAARGAVAGLARLDPYVGDLVVTRPQPGGAEARVDVVGEFTLTIVEGVTRD